MRKFYFLLTLLIAGFVSGIQAQLCNPDFNIAVQGNTVTASSVLAGDSSYQHEWAWGDGSYSNVMNPSHTYANCGVYSITHLVIKRDSVGAIACVDTAMQAVTIVCNTPCNIVPNFNIQSNPNQPNVITFTNTSISTLGAFVSWNFGDSSTSNGQSVVHTYNQGGVYRVCMRIVLNNTCIADTCIMVTVGNPNPTPCNVVANFTNSFNGATNSFLFISNSSNTLPGDSIRWSFGDGSVGFGSSIAHTFTSVGTYNVCLRVSRFTQPGTPPCVSEICRMITINQVPNPCPSTPRFNYNASATNGLVVVFNNITSQNAQMTTQWTFGDSTSGTGNTVSHQYQQSGNYWVCMRTTVGNCVYDTCMFVTVTATQPQPCNFNANFTSSVSPSQPNLYQFVNTSGASSANASITWNFGDGTSATGYSASHQYQQSGVYNVCIRVVVNNTCIRDTCKTIVVNTACNMIANFTNNQTPNSGNNLTYTFTNTSIGFAPGDSIRWTFGDSSAPAFASNPVHTFPRSGFYQVCLRIKKATVPGTLPCMREVCRTVYVSGQPPINCDSARLSFTIRRDTYMPNRVNFYASSNYFIQRQSWTITRLSDSNSVVLGYFNPMYTFSQTGTYRVCLRANTSGGCVKEYCDTITINAIAQQCILTAMPNPATSQVSVQATLTAANSIYAFIYNSQNVLVGQRIISGVSGNNLITFNISNLVSGYYTIRLYHSGQMCLSRFMKL
jgi:PKD repeat protein